MLLQFIRILLAVFLLNAVAVAASFESRVVLKHDQPGAFAIPKMAMTPHGSLVIVFQDRAGGDWGKRINPLLDSQRRWWKDMVEAARDGAK